MTFVYLIAPLAAGLLVGFFLRNRRLPQLDKLSLGIIVVLIFSLGFGIGSNNELIASLPQVGLQAVVIAALAIGFSIAFIKLGKRMVNSE